MSIKVYLAGGFFNNEDDWRYSMVNGLEGNIPYVDWSYSIKKWGSLPNSILNCFDFVGPYPENEIATDRRRMQAIEEADYIFLWLKDIEYTYDISLLSFELGYARALHKLASVGCKESSNDILERIQFAIDASYCPPQAFYADHPLDSFREAFVCVKEQLPLDKMMEFRRLNREARLLCGSHLEKSGYVYVIRADTGQYKIGRTNNIPNRMKLFTVKLPFDFEIVTYFPCESMYEIESHLHDFFSDNRVNGEWFNLDQEEVALLKRVGHAARGTILDKDHKPIEGLFHPPEGDWWSTLTQDKVELISR